MVLLTKLRVLLILLIIFIAGGLYTQQQLEQSSENLLAQIQKVVAAVQTEAWSDAQEHFKETADQWHRVEKRWALVTDHEEIDEIIRSLQKTKAYIHFQTAQDTLAELQTLIYLIKHIPEKEKLTLSTLF